MEGLSDDALAQVAAYFQALAEPTRLHLLNLLRQQPRSVGELAQLCGCSPANISRHLTLLTQHGVVVRESRRNSAYYSIADASIYQLCELACGNIARRLEQTESQRAAFAMPVGQRAKE
jgi:DNA-binding transcriptional ArsR family regulator